MDAYREHPVEEFDHCTLAFKAEIPFQCKRPWKKEIGCTSIWITCVCMCVCVSLQWSK